MTTSDILTAKRVVRQTVRERLASMPASEHLDASKSLGIRLEESIAFSKARLVVGFWPVVRDDPAFAPANSIFEPDIRPILARAIARGVRVGLPRLDWDSRVLEAAEIRDPHVDLMPDKHGLWAPTYACPKLQLSEVEAILVPGVAFTARGERLGRGGGFYDRFLALPSVARAVTIGICFEAQIFADIPISPHDVRLARIITESREILAGKPSV